jgi:hypothetical protein
VWRTNEKERGEGTSTKDTQSACAEEQGEEAKKGGRRGPGLERETRSGWYRGKDGASVNKKTGSSVDKKEERSRTREGCDGGTKEGIIVEQRSVGACVRK